MKRFLTTSVLAGAMVAPAAFADVTVDVDASAAWSAFMAVYDLNNNGDVSTAQGGFIFNSGWGLSDAVTTLDTVNNTVTASPNVIGDPNEFWYQGGRPGEDPGDPNDNGGPGALGNKYMEANSFVQDNSLVGEVITFQGTVLSNTLTPAHTMEIWIRDFTSDFSSFNETLITVPASGDFSITLATDDTDPTRNIQYGYTFRGENVWVTDVDPFGSVVLGAIPEPASLALVGLGGLAMLGRRRGA